MWVVAAWAAVMAAEPASAQEAVAAPGSAPGSGAVAAPGPASVPESVPARAAVPVSAPVSASVLVAPAQGSEGPRVEHGERVAGAVRRALEARGYRAAVSQELLGRAVIACQTPDCVVAVLDAAGVTFAIVPAIWVRQSGGEELTLTLVQRSGRNLNASGVVGDDLEGIVEGLVDELLVRRAAAGPATGPVPAPASAQKHPHAWKAGPIILIVGGAAAIVAVGVGAGIKSDTQQLNTTAVAVWSAVGAAAIAGGVAWWVVGDKRRRRAESTGALAPTIAFRPTGIDLRLRF